MKLCLILMCAFSLGLSATTHAQQERISLNMQQVTLKRLLDEIQQQTQLHFMVNREQTDQLGVISVKVENETVEKVLDDVFRNTRLTYKFMDGIIVVKERAIQRQDQVKEMVVSGQVIDEHKQPLPGVTVMIKGGTLGTVTDDKGHFTFKAPRIKDLVLVFSFIGMKTEEVQYTEQKELKVVMKEEVAEMDEVVVTGVFNKARESYTGAVTTITSKELARVGNRNILTSIRNIDPAFNIVEDINIGSDPNKLPNITVRGNSSLDVSMKDLQSDSQNKLSPNQPLFIMDGFEISLQRMMDLDESQVESITLLKDASATAMYGTRGANGVVVITTKQPEVGRLQVYYKGSLNIEAPDLTSYNLMNAREKLRYEKEAGLYEYVRADYQQDYIELYNSRLREVERGVDTYWLKYPVRTGLGHRHSLRLEGGTNEFRYAVGIAYNQVTGAMKGSDRNTLNGNMFFSYQYKNLKFQNDLQVAFNRSANSPYGNFYDYGKMNSYLKPYDDEGNLQMLLEDYFYLSVNGTSTQYNPLWNAKLPSIDKSRYASVRNNFAMDWKVTSDLIFRGRFGIFKQYDRSDKYVSAKNTKYIKYTEEDASRKGEYTYGTGETFNYEAELTLNYSKLFAEVHQLYVGMSYNFAEDKSENYEVKVEGISNPNMDFMGMASAYEKNGRPYGNEGIARRMGGILNANYTYNRRYFVDFSGKFDGSSKFGTDSRFAPFWSAGIGWNIHNESFVNNDKVLNIARLRVSYGSSGSQAFNPYQAMTTYRDYGNIYYEGWNGVYMMALGNKDLGWQTTKQMNVGLELELLRGRIRLNADYYNKLTDNLLSDITLPSSAGFDTYKANVGKVVNRGVELSFNAYLVRDTKREVMWSVGGTLAHNQNKIKSISNSLKFLNETLMKEDKANPSFLFEEGHSMNTIFAVRSMGIDPSTGNELFMKKNGQLSYEWDAKDKVACGIAEPKIWGNLNTMVRYKAFTLNAIFGYRYGGQMYNSTLVSKVENIYPYENADRRALYDRWKSPGEPALFKSIKDLTSTKASTRFVMDENTLECRSISLTYDMNTTWSKRHLGISYLSVSGYTEDVFRISTIKQERGLSYPFSRKFSVSVTARF